MISCFLLADEVGLGKTTIACEVINHLAAAKAAPFHAMYIASNSRIAAQNIQAFHHYDPRKIKKFQLASAQKIIKALIGKNPIPKRPAESLFPNPGDRTPPDRLSAFSGSDYAAWNRNYVLSFSPITSFSGGDLYTGSKEERKFMKEEFTNLSRILNSIQSENSIDIIRQIHSEFTQALYIAFRYKQIQENNRENSFSYIKKQAIQYTNQFTEEDELKWNADFSELRTIFDNANAFLMEPDIIILDEFQRFRQQLEPSSSYNVLAMFRFLSYLNSIGVIKTKPKILLLSATPYQFDHHSLELVWESGLELPEDKISAQEDTFADFEALKSCMQLFGTDTDKHPDHAYIARTERKFFYTDSDARMIQDIAVPVVARETYLPYCKYLTDTVKTLQQNNQSTDYCRYAAIAPEFWRFKTGYSSLKELNIQKSCTNPGDHYLLRTLIRNSFPDGTENRLWVVPVKGSEQDAAFGNFGKTLVFSHYRMTSRAIAALLSEYAEEKQKQQGIPPSIPDLKSCSFDEFFYQLNFHPENKKRYQQNLNEALRHFFNTPYAKRAVFRTMGLLWESYDSAVLEYCRKYRLADVLGEYRAVFSERSDQEFIDTLSSLLTSEDTGCEKGYPYSAASYYTDDPNENTGHDKNYEVRTASRFNSPFYPFVMAVTATAQEGLNFHYYADKLMHWQPAPNVNAFQQREGRIDRMGSITIRRRFYELCLCRKAKQFLQLDSRKFFLAMADQSKQKDIWDLLSPLLSDENREAAERACQAELFPMWYIPKLSQMSATIKRIMAATLCDPAYEAFRRLLDGGSQYSGFTENSRNLCPFLNIPEKIYVTAVSIEKGIIILIEPDGQLAFYRQTRIADLKEEERQKYILQGILAANWADFPQIPQNYRIFFEDEEVNGPAHRAFWPEEQPLPQEPGESIFEF